MNLFFDDNGDIFLTVLEDKNKTIKDGVIAPWLILNNLSTWTYGEIWTKRKEKTPLKNDWTIVIGRMVEHFFFYAAGLRSFGALAVPIQNVFFSNASSFFDRFGVLDSLGPFCTILDHPEPFQTILDHFLSIFDHFWPFPHNFWTFSLNIFWPFWPILWHFFYCHFGPFPDHCLIFSYHLLATLNHFLIIWKISWHFLTFRNISWHFRRFPDISWTIMLNRIRPFPDILWPFCDIYRKCPNHFGPFPDHFVPFPDHFLTISWPLPDHFLTISWNFLTILWHFLTI